jgi:pyruvate dehydrogenase E2 component (dihydrolipoamide acetyltransferase)
MPIPITIPRLGWTMEEGVFEGWLKKEGESVRAGDPLFALEGEKATQDIEAVDSGVLCIPPDAPKPGEVVAVGAVVGYLLAPGETPTLPPAPAASPGRESAAAGASDVSRTPAPARSHPAPEPQRHAIAGRASPGRGSIAEIPAISPRALRVAYELGVDWTALRGSGRSGRISERDVRRAHAARATLAAEASGLSAHGLAAPGGAEPFKGELQPLSMLRKTIAARLRAGVQSTVPVTITTEADATALLEWHRAAKARSGSTPAATPPSITDIIVRLSAKSLTRHPMIMGQWSDQGIRVPDGVHINVAVHTPGGLVAPVIRDADRLGLEGIAAASRTLIQLAREGQLTADQLASGTFTISNLGTWGIDAFTPILNAPQSAILGVGRIRRIAAVVGNEILPRDSITLSLTFDHRLIDGVPAAEFLNDLSAEIESPKSSLGIG